MQRGRDEKPPFTILSPKQNLWSRRMIKGAPFLEILDTVKSIAFYQKTYSIERGIRGFIFHGDVGIGKTTVAKAVACELGIPLIFVDGSDIARPYYGQSEMQIDQVFNEATKLGFAEVLIDDCESVFPTRDWVKGESWHIAQNNVFFHCLDEVNTSKTVVIRTTKRYDLLDRAIKDRLYSIEFPLPPISALEDIARAKCNDLHLEQDAILAEVKEGRFRTVRDLEKRVVETYVEKVKRMG